MQDWDADTFYLDPPDDTKKRTFFHPYRVELCVESVDTVTGQDPTTGDDIITTTLEPRMGNKWVVFDENLQQITLSKQEREVQEKEKQWHWCQEHKKLPIAAVWGQLDDDTQAKMELSANYKTHRENGNIIEISQVALRYP